MPTNLYTTVTIKDAEYSIKKFDAKTGLKLARLLISKAAPVIPLLEKIIGDKKQQNEPGEDAKIYEAVGC